MAATSFAMKKQSFKIKGQFFLPQELSIAEQILLFSNKKLVAISYDEYSQGNSSQAPIIRWSCFKEALDASFPSAGFGHSTPDTQQIAIPTSLSMCLENLEYRDISPKELQTRLDNTKRLIEIIHQLRTEKNLPLQERHALIESVQTLLEQRADPTVTDDNGWNILHLAAYFNALSLATWVGMCANENEEKILLATMTRDSEITPAGLAKQQGHVSVYEKLSGMNSYDEASSNSFTL